MLKALGFVVIFASVVALVCEFSLAAYDKFSDEDKQV